MSRRLLGRLLIGLILIAAAAAGAIRLLSPPAVQTSTPTRGPAVRAVYATGTVESGVTVRLAPRSAGRLVELKADEGQPVKAGQLLARLEDRDLAASVNELEARRRYAEQRLQRAQELRDKGFVSRDHLQQAQTEAQAASAALVRAREQLAYMSIRAPADGKIIKRDGEVGDLISTTQTLFFLATANAAPRIEAEVDEEDIALIQPGQKALIGAGAFPGKAFEGKVAQITPKGDPVARSYRVRIQLPPESPLMIGMTADVNIIVAERRNAMLIPASAVTNGTVWLIRDGRLAKQAIQSGVSGPEQVEVLSGLKDDDKVVTQPSEKFEAGQRVRLVAAAPAIAATGAGK